MTKPCACSGTRRRCNAARLLTLLLAVLPLACAQRSEVDAAFAAVRRGDSGPVSQLKVVPAEVPAIAKYLKDSNEDVRREALVLLSGVGGNEACTALATSLTDSSADMRERAGRAIYEKCPAQTRAAIPKLEAALQQSVRMGNASAEPLLLLSRYRDEGNREFLKSLQSDAGTMVKFEPWNSPVPQSLAASVAGVSAGVPGARERVLAGLQPLSEAEFLAMSLNDIEDTATLKSLLKLLDDQRTISAGVPSGAQPQRRLCDLAVDMFTERLGLKPSFALRTSDRYTDAEIQQIRDLAAKALANG